MSGFHPFTREWWSDIRRGARYGWLYGWMVGGAASIVTLVMAGVYVGAAALLVGAVVGYGLARAWPKPSGNARKAPPLDLCWCLRGPSDPHDPNCPAPTDTGDAE